MSFSSSALILTPQQSILTKVQRGYYMSSVITADARGRCAQCAGTDFKITVIDPKIKLSIATCASCGSFPDKIRIRRSLPIGLDGKANRVDIRYNRIGEKIADIEEAKHIARSIDYDIKSVSYTHLMLPTKA